MRNTNFEIEKTITNKDIPDKVAEVTVAIQSILGQVSYIAFTSDCWSANNNAYMSLTAHFLDSSLELRTCLLGLVHVPESHTGVYLSEKTNNLIIDKWNVKEKVIF